MFDLRSQPSVTSATSASSEKARDDAGRSRSGSRKQLAAELARVDKSLAKLRERVGDLYALQRDHEESSSVLANRVGALEGAAPASPVPDLVVAARIDAMAAQFDAVRAETALLSDGLAELDLRVRAADSEESASDRGARRLELDALFARMKGAEGALAAAQAELTRLDQRLAAPADQVRSETVVLLEQRVASVLDDLQLQQRRIEALDRGDQDIAHRAEVERRIGDLRDALGARLGALEQGLEHGLDRAQVQVRTHLDQRLGRMGTSLGLFGLGLSILFFTGWWQTTHRADSTDLRVESLGTRIDRALETGVVDVSTAVASLSDGLTRLEQRVAQLGEVSSVGPSVSPKVASDSRSADRADALLIDGPRAGQDAGQGAASIASLAPGTAANASLKAMAEAPPPEAPAEVPIGAITGALTEVSAEAPTPESIQAPASAHVPELVPNAVPEKAPVPVGEGPGLVGDAETRAAVASTPSGPLVLDAPRWMVQLIGFHSQDSVRDFVSARGIAGDAWTVQGSYRGRPWYRVLVGDYADGAAAAAAIDALPPEMRALAPIVRLLEPGTQLEPTDRN